MKPQSATFGSTVLWPVGCPKPKGDVENVNKHVHKWLHSENNNFFTRRNAGEYGSLALTAASIFGLFKSESKVKKWLCGTLGGVGLLATTFFHFCAYGSKSMNAIYNKFLIWPKKKMIATPEEKGITKYEKVEIDVGENDKLKGIYVPSTQNPDTKATVLYLSGRKHNASYCYETIKKLSDKIGANILLVDYRGTGESTGKATFDNTLEDIEKMYDYLVEKKGCSAKNITVAGHSLGGGFAQKLALKKPVNGLMLISSITDTVNVAKDNSSFFPNKIISLVLEEQFDCSEDIKDVKADNILIIHADDDEIVPPHRAGELYEQIKDQGNSEYILMHGGKHNEYIDHLTDECVDSMKRIVFQHENPGPNPKKDES